MSQSPIVLPATTETSTEQGMPLFSASGLTEAQVLESRQRFGTNSLPTVKRIPWWRQYLEGFRDRTILILLGAAILAVILGFLSKEIPFDGIAILCAVFIATTTSFINEYRAEADFEQLKSVFERNTAIVIRDGTERKITFDQVVVGDLVDLSAGYLVPADGRIVRSADLAIDTAPLDGESVPKEKGVGGNDPDYARLLRGYRVIEGTAQMVVTAVGTGTAMWVQIVQRMQQGREDERRMRTPLEERLDGLANKIGLIGFVASFLIFATLILRSLVILATDGRLTLHGNAIDVGLNSQSLLLLLDYVLVAATVVVVAVPEGLPMAVTISLALSARRIARDNTLVRSSKAVETVGQVNVICTDKTGTLTENHMVVQRVYVHGQSLVGPLINQMGKHPAFPLLALNLAVNATAALHYDDGKGVEYLGNPTEAALLAWLESNGQSYRALREQAVLRHQIAFSSATKLMMSTVTLDGHAYTLIKGAPEVVMEKCAWVQTDQGAAPIHEHRAAIQAEVEAQAAESMRTLAIAFKPLPDGLFTAMTADSEAILLAVIGLADPIRQGVPEAIQLCRSAGIDVKMVTGDNALTALSIAQQLGLIDHPDQVLLASELYAMPLAQKRQCAHELRVLARAVPSDKEDLVRLLQEDRLVVAVTGDGINDGPALQRADVGIAMGVRGTDVAKEVSNIVLLDDNFATIVRAVHWGRALFENIQRFLQFQLTITFSALAIIFFSTLFGLTGEPGESPLTVIQLLWINLIMDTLAVLAYCKEPATPDQMQHKPKGRTEPFITPAMRTNVILMSSYFTLAILILIAILRADGIFDLHDSAIIFSTYVFLQIFNEINARSLDPNHSPLQGLTRNPTLLALISFIAIVQLIMTQIGGTVGQEVFRTAPLPLGTWLLILLVASTSLLVGEASRLVRRRVLQHS
jgi:Ca2+-transporting ATPase